MRIILTSFRDAPNWGGETFSIARWQPKGCSYPSFPVDITPVWKGKPMKGLPPEEFKEKYIQILESNWSELRDALIYRMDKESGIRDVTLTLLCWCNPIRQAGYEKLYCHRILLGYWIEANFLPRIEGKKLQVIYGDGADNPVWERPPACTSCNFCHRTSCFHPRVAQWNLESTPLTKWARLHDSPCGPFGKLFILREKGEATTR